jgi:hypothetical protein
VGWYPTVDDHMVEQKGRWNFFLNLVVVKRGDEKYFCRSLFRTGDDGMSLVTM